MSIHKLTATKIATLVRAGKQGKFGDGGGLYLQIDGRSVSWLFRYKSHGRERAMGLGPLHTVGLENARAAALAARQGLLDGRDPLAERGRAGRAVKTLDECIALFLADKKEAFSVKHRQGLGADAGDLCQPAHRAIAGQRHRPAGGPAGPSTDLAHQDQDRQPSPQPDGERASMGDLPRSTGMARTRRAGRAISSMRCRRSARVHEVEHHAALSYEHCQLSCASSRRRPACRRGHWNF